MIGHISLKNAWKIKIFCCTLTKCNGNTEDEEILFNSLKIKWRLTLQRVTGARRRFANAAWLAACPRKSGGSVQRGTARTTGRCRTGRRRLLRGLSRAAVFAIAQLLLFCSSGHSWRAQRTPAPANIRETLPRRQMMIAMKEMRGARCWSICDTSSLKTSYNYREKKQYGSANETKCSKWYLSCTVIVQ